MVQFTIMHEIIIDGDDDEILHLTTIHEILEVRDSDHVKDDGMYLVDENGQL